MSINCDVGDITFVIFTYEKFFLRHIIYMNLIPKFLAFMRECLFPGGCAICGRILLDGEESMYSLCGDCMTLFTVNAEPRCPSCGRPLIFGQGPCLSCRKQAPFHFDGGFALYPYAGKHLELLRAYKFDGFHSLVNFLVLRLLDIFFQFPSGEFSSFSWVPVPPRPGKIRKTGWDQSSYLARRLDRLYRRGYNGATSISADSIYLPVCSCLKRLPSKTQKELNQKDRRRNLKGRIIRAGNVPRRVLLFDDVITTGSTLDACAEILKKNGVEKVYAVSLFYRQ